MYFWNALKTAQKNNLRIGSREIEGFLCSACLKDEVCRRQKPRQSLLGGLHESCSTAEIATGSVMAQKWASFFPADPLHKLERSVQALFQRGNSVFVTEGPQADRMFCSKHQTFPVICSLKFWEAKNNFYGSCPKKPYLEVLGASCLP